MFFQTLLVGALASLAIAQSTVLSFDRVPNPVTAGQPQAITYLTNDTTSPVSIILRKGASGNLDTIATLTDDATGGQYIWTPSNSLENDGDYALEIRQGTQVNYYGPFTLQGSTEEGSSSSATGTATSSSSRSGVTAPATYPAGNSTATAFGTGTAGTGSPITRNTTMNTATLRPTSTSSRTTAPSSSTPSDLQASATPSGAASSLMAGGSAIALVLGAVGAIVVG